MDKQVHESGALGHDAIAGKLLSTAQMIALFVWGLLPIVFLPMLAAPLGYTKIVFAGIGLFVSLIFFLFYLLREGAITVRFEVPILLAWLCFGIASISAIFSGDFFDSFLGTELTPHSGVFTGILAFTMTLWMILGRDKRLIIRLYLLLALSAVLLAVFHLSRIIFGTDFLALGIFGGNVVASPFSEWNSLAIFFGLVIILSLIALEQLRLRAPERMVFGVVVALSLTMLVIINFTAVFVVLGLVSLVMLVYGLTKGKLTSPKVSAPSATVSSLPIIVAFAMLFVSALFVVGGSFMGGAVSRLTGVSYIEVRPSPQATIDIAKAVYKDHLLLGVGPNRFVDAWRLHRDPSINGTIFWNTNFQAGYGFVPTLFVTNGILGGLAWLLFFGALFFVGMRTLLRSTLADPTWYFIALSSFTASVYLWGISFIYVPGPVLLLLAALCTGIFFASRHALAPAGERTFKLLQNPRVAFGTVGVIVLLIVASVGGMFSLGRHFAATYVFASGLLELNRGGDIASATGRMVSAFALHNDDTFARQTALYQQSTIMSLLQSGKTGEEVQQAFKDALAGGVEAGRTAVALDATEPDNWMALARVYATVIPLNIENAYDLAKEALEKAQVLDPQNPSRFVALAELELLKKNVARAHEYIDQAIALKSNYTDAIYVLAQIQIAENDVEAAIASTRATTLLDANNPVRFFQLGILQVSTNKIPEGIASFEHAIALSPDYSNARYFLAFAYDAQGRRDEAKTELEEVLRLNPGNAEVQGLIDRLSSGMIGGQPAPSGQALLTETSENTNAEGVVTSGTAPDSPLLSPVNTDTASPTDE